MQRFLYYFKCRHCATWAATDRNVGGYVPCNGCGGSKKFESREPVQDGDPQHEEIWTYARQYGVAHLPLPGQAKPCARCGIAPASEHRMGQFICSSCYHAEIRPTDTPKQLTPEEWDAFRRSQRQAQADDDERMAAAHAAMERDRAKDF